MKTQFSLSGLVLIFATTSASPSDLSDAVASMSPGDLVVFDTNGMGHSLLDACDGTHSILEWSNKAQWDAQRREFRFVGQGHYSCMKHIVYTESTNSWTTSTNAPNVGMPGHAYEHNAMDPATGDLYYRHYYSRTIDKFTRSTKTWSTLDDCPMVSRQVAGGVEYFPEMEGLIFSDSVGGVWIHTSSWEQISDALPMGNYHNFMSYNPTHKVILFGGGNGSKIVYKLGASGTITRVSDSPVIIGISEALTVPDPLSGLQLVFADNGTMYEYDIEDDSWSSAGSHDVMSYARDWRVAAPISTHGVIMFITWDFDNSKVLLYKHSPGQLNPPPPPDPDPEPDPDPDPEPEPNPAPMPPSHLQVR